MSDKDEVFPRYSLDLLEELDSTIAHPQFPKTQSGIAQVDEAYLRQVSFQAGARWLVDMLIAWHKEWNEGEDQTDVIDEHDPFGRVFGPDGEPHSRVASLYLAGQVPPEVGQDDGGHNESG